jgi:hypothetical protein
MHPHTRDGNHHLICSFIQANHLFLILWVEVPIQPPDHLRWALSVDDDIEGAPPAAFLVTPELDTYIKEHFALVMKHIALERVGNHLIH